MRPRTLCTTEAIVGAPLRRPVWLKRLGKTRSRPRAKVYRATVLWNEIIAANTEVAKRTTPMSTRTLDVLSAARPKMRPGPASPEALAMFSGPVATDMAHDDSVYTAAMMRTEMYVARAMVRRGFLLSSEKTTDDTNTTKPSTATTSTAQKPDANRYGCGNGATA